MNYQGHWFRDGEGEGAWGGCDLEVMKLRIKFSSISLFYLLARIYSSYSGMLSRMGPSDGMRCEKRKASSAKGARKHMEFLF